GAVDVSAGPWWDRTTRQLTADQGVVTDAKGTLGQVAPVNAANVAAWQRGKIVFEDMPLAQVVQEMNRYLPMPASFAAPGLAQYRVGGVFGIDDPLAMMNALPAIAPVRVLQAPDGRLQVVGR
ncbi:MAG TPA: FecR family protein, partial [Bordetella sp.]